MKVSESSVFATARLLPKKGLGRLVECIVLLWVLLSDPDVPTWAKVLIAGALAYLVCPIDAVPDFLPGGFLDDAVTLAGALAKTSSLITDRHWGLARRKRSDLGF